MAQVTNPIMPGCYPDPSICRVGDDYYLVLSTFEDLPGLPIFHSRDLAHWEQIGHALDRETMMDFAGTKSSHGIFAPTIRYNPNDHKFYLVCTLVDHRDERTSPKGNFVITADNPAGPWSDPIWLDKPGIDPSLFFDADGKVWLHGTRLREPGEWYNQTEVWLQELDPQTLQTKGEEYILWSGAVRGAVWTEGPHIYRIGDYYYLLTAEAGTEFNHAISIARAKDITGSYEGTKRNPIFTHRNLGRNYPIMGVGHADLVPAGKASFEDRDAGPWYAVMLAMRLYGGYHYNLGRETFLVPVTWEDDWPVFAIGEGRIPDVVEVPDVPSVAVPSAEEPSTGRRLETTGTTVRPNDLRWTALRALPSSVAQPVGDAWRLPVGSTPLSEAYTPSFLGIRQTAQDFELSVKLDVSELAAGAWAGVAIRQNETDFATIMVSPKPGGGYVAQTRLAEKGEDKLVSETEFTTDNATMTVEVKAQGQDYVGSIVTAEGARIPMGTIDGRTLDTAATGGFLGLWLGIYAYGPDANNGSVTATLSYRPLSQ